MVGRVEAGDTPRRNVDKAHAGAAADRDVCFAGDVAQAIQQCTATSGGLAMTGIEHDGAPRTAIDGRQQRGFEVRRANAEDGKVGGGRKLRDTAIARAAKDSVLFRIDEVDAPIIPGAQYRLRQTQTKRTRACRRADHRDRARLQHRRQAMRCL